MILFAEVVLFTRQSQKWHEWDERGELAKALFFVRTYKTLGMPDSMDGDCWRHLGYDGW